MYSYCNSVMEPWDGPAALAMTDGRWVCGGLDRNGLRPMRYVVTGDGLLIAGSEAGMVPIDEGTVREKGALGPGQMIAVDMKEGKLYHDVEIKDKLAARAALRRMGRQDQRARRRARQGHRGRRSSRAPSCAAARSRPAITIEELEQILAPMAEDGKETDRLDGRRHALARCCPRSTARCSHFFRQNFSQVTNPPIDSLREFRVMSLKTRFGNLKNVLDERQRADRDPRARQPLRGQRAVRRADAATSTSTMVEIDCTFAAGAGRTRCATGSTRIRAEAEDAVRSGAGHIVLTDQHQDEDQGRRCR